MRDNDAAQAERWRQKILADFPDSPYGTAMKDPDYFSKLREMHLRQEEIYREVYDAYLDNKNEKATASQPRWRRNSPFADNAEVRVHRRAFIRYRQRAGQVPRTPRIPARQVAADRHDGDGRHDAQEHQGRTQAPGRRLQRARNARDTRLTADTLAAPKRRRAASKPTSSATPTSRSISSSRSRSTP